MNFLAALKHAEQGERIRREGWSTDPHEDSFHNDLVIGGCVGDKRLLANRNNSYFSPDLTTTDYRARDWKVVES